MKKKGMVKFQGVESRGLMHYVEYEGGYVSITRNSSRKIKVINNTGKLKVTFGLLSKDYAELPVEIIEDISSVKKVFNFMKDNKHTHYKTFVDDLVILKYSI